MIYLFNQTEELIDVIDEASLADFTHTIELNRFDRASFEIPVDYKPNIIKEAQFFGFQSRDRAFCLFRISEKSYDLGLSIQGIDRAESDLHSFIIEDKRPGGTASDVLREILKGTGYHLGNVDGLTINGNMSFYYISVRQALVKLIESYACEFKIRYTFVENKIIGRYIDLNQRFGRKTGHQFEYGSNILNVTYEESSDEVVTALIGRGKGEQSTNESGEATGGYGRRIQFKDVVWSVSKGDPVDKPAGQNYVANEAARNIYGLHQNGVIKHRFGVYTNEDIEDPVELLKATYKELKRLSVPIVTFKANLLDLANAIEQDIWIGDSVGIVRDQIGIAFEARIHKLIIDKLDDNRSVVELGDYQTLQAKDRSTRQQAIKDAVSGFSEGLIEEAIANEVDRQNKEFDEKIRVNKLEFDNELQRAKERAEEIKRQISSEIDKKFQSFDNAAINEARRKAEEAIRNAGASTLLAQEAKRIGLDSVAKLEEFKRQATSAQTALLGDLDVLKRTIANDIRPKQAQAEAEISKQVEALVQTKKELAGVKSAQSTFEQSTTRRLSELTNLANGKASKSELTQTAEELTSKIASVQVAHRNQGDRVSAIESNFKQRADALDAGVRSLTEGLRTKADISSLNVTAENIRQSVKSLETSTQNKLDQKLSMTEFEVRAGSIHQEILNATKDKADKTLVMTEAGKLREEFSNLRVGGTNLLKGSKGPFLPDRKPANFDNAILYAGNTSIYMEQGQEYIISAKTDGTFTAHHDGNKESDNVVLWIMDKDVRNYQIVSDLKTGTTGTKITWNKPTGIYHLRVNTYHKEATKSVWDVKIEKGNVATDWSPAPEDTDGLITEAKAIFERTAQGLRADLSAIQEYVNKDGQRQEALRRYSREESAKQATAVRELVTRDYVGKSAYQEDVRGIERRLEAITNPQNGSIATQIAKYKTAVDGRFADITSMIAGKANQVDFQRVRETSQLYERILGNTENGIADKVARMAMTNQLFQVEVGKAFAEHQNLFLNSTLTKGFLGNNGIIYVANTTQKEVTSDFISVDPNEKIIFQHWVTLPENGMAWTAWQFFDKNKKAIDARVTGLNAYKTATGKQHNINQIIVPANAYFIRVSARMYNDGLIKIERGSAPSNYSAAPEDTDEAIRTVQSQLAGAWGVHNKNSVNEIIAGFNLAGRNAGIKAETIRLEGNTLADKLTAIDGYFKRLFVGEGTFATLNTDVIRTNSITADKLVFNEALANRMVSNEIITSKLVASRAFVNALKAVTIDASQIVTGTLKGDRIYGGTIRGTEINGTTITGNSRMTIGDNGFLRPTQEGGLQINVPETYSASKGVGVQLLGRELGRIPKGMFIYNSPNWNGGNIIGDNTEDILLTVKGRVSLCNLHNGSPVSGVPIISNFEYQNPIRNLYPIRFIGWDPRSNQLYVDDGTGKSGTWWISVDGSTSDKNLKTNIGDTHYNALDFVQKLMFKEFDWKTDKFGYKKPYTNVGLIAQDVEKIDSSLVYKKGETLALDDFRLLNIALKAIQELALENRKLTHRLENLENERRTA